MPLDDSVASYEEQSPTLLAAQPPSLDTPDTAPGKNWDQIFTYLEGRMQSLRMWRWSWWSYWQVLARFLLPRRNRWVIVANRFSKGSPINDEIVDSTATLAMQTCAAGMWTGLTSPSRPWFKLGVALPWIKLDADAKEWLEDTEQRLYTVLAGSNFYNSMAQFFQDVATFGTSVLIEYEDFEDVARFYVPCVGEYYLACGSRFSVDVLYREFVLTIPQIVEMFTLENCPAEIREMWEEGGASLDTERIVAHAIEPNNALAGRGEQKGKSIRVVPGKFTFREVYWLKGDKCLSELSRKGFNDNPFMVGRWSTVANDPYGRGPGMDALGDTKQVQQETRRKAEFIDKGVRPPMGANPELKNEPSSILPGNITYTNTSDGKKGFWPLFEPNPAWLAGITADIDKVNARVEKCFFVDLFMAISRMEGVQPRNELELTKRDLERLQSLGPFINLFETDVAGRVILRTLGILERRRLLKPMPDSLKHIPLKINHVSIMKLAQRASETVALKDVLTTGGQISLAAKSAGLPDPLRVINLDEALREFVELSNANPKIMYTEQEVAEHDAIRNKAHQQLQTVQNSMEAVNAAKALGDTQTGPSTALGAILGHGGGTPLNPSGGV